MRNRLLPATFATTALLIAGSANAQDGNRGLDDERPAADRPGIEAQSRAGEQSEAQMTVDEALQALEQMKLDEAFSTLLDDARGVFIIPDYAKVAAIVGGEGGEGVALLKQGEGQDAEWSAPAFYNIGGASVGAEVGAKAGRVAMLIMNDETAEMFMSEENNWSLNADAGVTIVDYSAAVEGSAGQGDVIVWSETKGAFAGASVGISDISQDEEENEAYHGQDVDARDILSGNVSTDRGQELRDALTG